MPSSSAFPVLATSATNSSCAAAIATARASRSSAREPRERATCAAAASRTSGPTASPGATGVPVSKTIAVAISGFGFEVALDQSNQRAHCGLRVRAFRAEMQKCVLGCLGLHLLDDAFHVRPRSFVRRSEFDPGTEALRQLRKPDRATRMQPDLVQHAHLSFFLLRHLLRPYAGLSSSAVRRTSSSDDPADASVAAITAPSTIGALHTTTRVCCLSGNISIAISLLVSAPPRSTSTATPASDHARLIAARTSSTLLPNPPPGAPPHHARGTSSPTICLTISAAPRATSGECDTITIPTFEFTPRPP